MSVTSNQPANLNFLSPLGFKFQIHKLPNTVYFLQSFDFPEISLNESDGIQTPFSKIVIPGDHMTWGKFSFDFKIDEDMKNYFEIYDWIVAIAKPDRFDQYQIEFSGPKGLRPVVSTLGVGPRVDGDLMILNSALKPNIKVTFIDIIPVSLSGFKFDSTQTDVAYISATASFKYFGYIYERL